MEVGGTTREGSRETRRKSCRGFLLIALSVLRLRDKPQKAMQLQSYEILRRHCEARITLIEKYQDGNMWIARAVVGLALQVTVGEGA